MSKVLLPAAEHEPGPALEGDFSDAMLRARAYRLLGALLKAPPPEELLAQLRNLPSVDESVGELTVAWCSLRDSAKQISEYEVNAEYHTLFIGLGSGELVPYASWYIARTLMGKPLVDVRRDLKTLGIARRDQVREPEDHAAALCEVMALLVEDPAPESLQRQATFFDANLSPWLGRFFRDMRYAPAADFYRSVGLYGERFIAFESQYLNMLV